MGRTNATRRGRLALLAGARGLSLTGLYSTIGQRSLFALDAEWAHGLSIAALKTGIHPRFRADSDQRLKISVAGLHFPNPLGMAAGYDKNADVPDQLLAMGFGHVEIGTVTPRPQPGNPKPRIFRLREDRAVINRLGFNSKGHADVRAKLESRGKEPGIVGINIGANKTSEDFAADYVAGVRAFAHLASYFTINISSPNTPGLRALQDADPLTDLLKRVLGAREEETEKNGRPVPVFLKIAPDLSETEIDAIAKAVSASKLDGLIVSNTTLSRTGLENDRHSNEAGGLSGQPLFERSTIVLAKMQTRLGSDFPLIGVGGVHDTKTAFTKIEAGARLVQLYTGLIYGGPGLPGKILRGMSTIVDDEGLTSIGQATGRKAEEWASRPI